MDDGPRPFNVSSHAMSNPSPASLPPFFSVSIRKLIVMSFCTFGFYEPFWFYKHWVAIRTRTSADISPAARTVFAFIFCYPLLKTIRDFGSSDDRRRLVPAAALTAGWVITSMCWKLPGPYWWVSMFAVAFLVPAQAVANAANKEACPQHGPNDEFTKWNWAVIVPVGLMLVLALIGSFMPEPQV